MQNVSPRMRPDLVYCQAQSSIPPGQDKADNLKPQSFPLSFKSLYNCGRKPQTVRWPPGPMISLEQLRKSKDKSSPTVAHTADYWRESSSVNEQKLFSQGNVSPKKKKNIHLRMSAKVFKNIKDKGKEHLLRGMKAYYLCNRQKKSNMPRLFVSARGRFIYC